MEQMKMEETKVKSPPRWRDHWVDFLQNTTMHGVRYLVGTRLIRKIIWAIIVLAAAILFVYMVWKKLQFLLSHPKNVNVEVTYADELPFPAVTICNENTVRLTALQNSGMYDLLTNNNVLVNTTKDDYEFVENICAIKSNKGSKVKSGTKHMIRIAETTRQVCIQLCSHSYDLTCSSVLYDRSDRTCLLSSYTGDQDRLNSTCEDQKKEFYRRKRSLFSGPIQLDFEDEEREKSLFSMDMEKNDRWMYVKASAKQPDNTFNSKHGNYLLFLETDKRPSYRAAFMTPYINTKKKKVPTATLR